MASPEKSLSKKSSKPKSKAKKGKRKLRHIGIEPADNGGFNVSHQYDGEPGPDGAQGSPQMETHALGGPDDLLAHIQNTTGGQLPPAGGAAGPAAGAGGGM